MAKIIDPDDLVRASGGTDAPGGSDVGTSGNIYINVTYKWINLGIFGSMTTDGVTMQAVYSYLKEEWKTDPELIKYPFPMVAITPEQFEFVDGWQPADQPSVNLFRDGGFAVKNTDGSSSSEFAGIITLGSLGASDQVYYQQTIDGVAFNINLTGAVNQVVKVYGHSGGTTISFTASTDTIASTVPITTFAPGEVITISGSGSNDGDFTILAIAPDYLSMTVVETGVIVDESAGATVDILADTRTKFDIFVREYAKLYAQSSLLDIGVTTLTYQAYRFPLANSADLKVTHQDTVVGGFDISNIDGTGTLVTVDTINPDGHGLTVGDEITISGTTGYNGTFIVESVTDSDTFTYLDSANAGVETAGLVQGSVYADMDITYYTSNQDRIIGGVTYEFDKIIDADVVDDGNLPTAEEIYEFVQWSLRQDETHDIDADPVNEKVGKTANILLTFVGDTLVTSTGVYIDDFSDTDINRIEFYDVNGIKRTFPFVSAGVINFNGNLVDDSGAVYRMFFTDANGNNFGDSDALLVQSTKAIVGASDIVFDASNGVTSTTTSFAEYSVGTIAQVEGTSLNDGYYAVATIISDNSITVTPLNGVDTQVESPASTNVTSVIAGDVQGATVQFTFDYDGNIQGGRTAGTDAPITTVAIGLDRAQYVKATSTIVKSNANSVSLVASLERNYSNP